MSAGLSPEEAAGDALSLLAEQVSRARLAIARKIDSL